MEEWNTTWLGMPNIILMEAHKYQELVNSQEKLITLEEIFLDIGKQMLEISYTLLQGKLFKIVLKFKQYLWQKLKLKKTQNVSKTTIDKQVGFSIPKVGTTVVAIDNCMVVIQIQIGKNEDVLLDEGSGINIIIKQLKLRLELPKPKPAPYNLRMANQTTTKPMGFIKDLFMALFT